MELSKGHNTRGVGLTVGNAAVAEPTWRRTSVTASALTNGVYGSILTVRRDDGDGDRDVGELEDLLVGPCGML